MNDDVSRYLALEEKKKEVDKKIIRLEEQYKNKRKLLSDLIEQIKKEGYDPNNLKQIKATLEADLKKAVDDFESNLKEVSQKISSIESIL